MRTVLCVAVAALLSACATESKPRAAGPRPTRHTVAQQQMPDPGAPRAVARESEVSSEPTKNGTSAASEADLHSSDPVTTQLSQTYRVTADGTVGCEDPAALQILRRLRETGGASPRLLAQAHRDGRCMTVFRQSEWALESVQEDMAKLRLTNGSGQGRPVSLYFLRSNVRPS
jgi:hypothetical protein